MAVKSYWRGWPIRAKKGIWYYIDTNLPVASDPHRICGNCHKSNRSDEHDTCLGNLPNVKNA